MVGVYWYKAPTNHAGSDEATLKLHEKSKGAPHYINMMRQVAFEYDWYSIGHHHGDASIFKNYFIPCNPSLIGQLEVCDLAVRENGPNFVKRCGFVN